MFKWVFIVVLSFEKDEDKCLNFFHPLSYKEGPRELGLGIFSWVFKGETLLKFLEERNFIDLKIYLNLEEKKRLLEAKQPYLWEDYIGVPFGSVFVIVIFFIPLLILKIICLFGVDIGGHILDSWLFYLWSMVIFLLSFSWFTLIAWELF